MAETVLPPKITDATVTLSFSFTWDSVVYATGAYYGYCEIDDVQYEFANLNGYTTLTSSVIAQAVANASLEIHEALQFVYSMPYGGTNQNILGKLREMNAKLAFARLVERYFTANMPNHSEAADLKAAWVNHQVENLIAGTVRWDSPFGDATGTHRLPAFDHSAVSGGTPNPYSGDSAAEPIFKITSPGTRWNGGNSL